MTLSKEGNYTTLIAILKFNNSKERETAGKIIDNFKDEVKNKIYFSPCGPLEKNNLDDDCSLMIWRKYTFNNIDNDHLLSVSRTLANMSNRSMNNFKETTLSELIEEFHNPEVYTTKGFLAWDILKNNETEFTPFCFHVTALDQQKKIETIENSDMNELTNICNLTTGVESNKPIDSVKKDNFMLFDNDHGKVLLGNIADREYKDQLEELQNVLIARYKVFITPIKKAETTFMTILEFDNSSDASEAKKSIDKADAVIDCGLRNIKCDQLSDNALLFYCDYSQENILIKEYAEKLHSFAHKEDVSIKGVIEKLGLKPKRTYDIKGNKRIEWGQICEKSFFVGHSTTISFADEIDVGNIPSYMRREFTNLCDLFNLDVSSLIPNDFDRKNGYLHCGSKVGHLGIQTEAEQENNDSIKNELFTLAKNDICDRYGLNEIRGKTSYFAILRINDDKNKIISDLKEAKYLQDDEEIPTDKNDLCYEISEGKYFDDTEEGFSVDAEIKPTIEFKKTDSEWIMTVSISYKFLKDGLRNLIELLSSKSIFHKDNGKTTINKIIEIAKPKYIYTPDGFCAYAAITDAKPYLFHVTYVDMTKHAFDISSDKDKNTLCLGFNDVSGNNDFTILQDNYDVYSSECPTGYLKIFKNRNNNKYDDIIKETNNYKINFLEKYNDDNLLVKKQTSSFLAFLSFENAKDAGSAFTDLDQDDETKKNNSSADKLLVTRSEVDEKVIVFEMEYNPQEKESYIKDSWKEIKDKKILFQEQIKNKRDSIIKYQTKILTTNDKLVDFKEFVDSEKTDFTFHLTSLSIDNGTKEKEKTEHIISNLETRHKLSLNNIAILNEVDNELNTDRMPKPICLLPKNRFLISSTHGCLVVDLDGKPKNYYDSYKRALREILSKKCIQLQRIEKIFSSKKKMLENKEIFDLKKITDEKNDHITDQIASEQMWFDYINKNLTFNNIDVFTYTTAKAIGLLRCLQFYKDESDRFLSLLQKTEDLKREKKKDEEQSKLDKLTSFVAVLAIVSVIKDGSDLLISATGGEPFSWWNVGFFMFLILLSIRLICSVAKEFNLIFGKKIAQNSNDNKVENEKNTSANGNSKNNKSGKKISVNLIIIFTIVSLFFVRNVYWNSSHNRSPEVNFVNTTAMISEEPDVPDQEILFIEKVETATVPAAEIVEKQIPQQPEEVKSETNVFPDQLH